MITVTPLDPNTPAGVRATRCLNEVLGQLQANVWARQAARPQPQTPSQPDTPKNPPSRPPAQPPRPSGPKQPTRGALELLAA